MKYRNNASFSNNDLKSFYKKVRICIICRKKYGLDYPKDNHICPICEEDKRKSNKTKKSAKKGYFRVLKGVKK